MNPELRQTLNTISRNFESANEAAQENIFTFTQLVIDPCVNGFKTCILDCTSACFPNRDERLRRHRARSRGRSDLHFDFYDDWVDEEEEGYAQGPWANDELDSLLAGRGSRRNSQPGRQRAMSYGTKNRRPAHAPGEENPTIIPSSSYLGFLERFKWRPGARGLRYKPSAADLQEHPGVLARREEAEPLMEQSDEDGHLGKVTRHKRQRSNTQASNSTTNSLSSRGDLIIGDEEDDAVPLDDEFAVMLSRQTTNGPRRPGTSRKSTRTDSSKSNRSLGARRSNSSRMARAFSQSPLVEQSEVEPPSMDILNAEEDRLRREQEMEIAQRREAASQLAKDRGLDDNITRPADNLELKDSEQETQRDMTLAPENATPPKSSIGEIEERLGLASPLSSAAGYAGDSETEPFPSFPTSPAKEMDEFEHPP